MFLIYCVYEEESDYGYFPQTKMVGTAKTQKSAESLASKFMVIGGGEIEAERILRMEVVKNYFGILEDLKPVLVIKSSLTLNREREQIENLKAQLHREVLDNAILERVRKNWKPL